MTLYIRQNDTSPSLSATLTDSSGNGINLTGAVVRFLMKDLSDVVKIDEQCTINNASEGVVSYVWSVGDTDTPGIFYFAFEVTYQDSSVESFPNKGNLSIVITKEF